VKKGGKKKKNEISEDFIRTEKTKECGFEAGEIGRVKKRCT
jgi:hypothetical protein